MNKLVVLLAMGIGLVSCTNALIPTETHHYVHVVVDDEFTATYPDMDVPIIPPTPRIIECDPPMY